LDGLNYVLIESSWFVFSLEFQVLDMNWLQFIDSMVGHLIWPTVVLIVAFAVRKHLGSLAQRILELSFGGATLKFGELISKGTEIIEESPTPPSFTQPAGPRLPLPLPGAEPVRSVFSAFDEVDRLLDELGGRLDVKTRGATLMDMLWRRGYVTKDIVELYRSLRTARNAIAHGQAGMPSEAESLEFARQASFLDAALGIALDAMKAEKDKR
jgi:hypothetical protein